MFKASSKWWYNQLDNNFGSGLKLKQRPIGETDEICTHKILHLVLRVLDIYELLSQKKRNVNILDLHIIM